MKVRRRMRDLSTEQKPSEESHTRVPHPGPPDGSPVSGSSNGSHYAIANKQWLRRHPHHCGPRLHKSGVVPPL
jgi:hypothetical protein